ncbi:DNA invertase [Enterococcus thailandicus]|uniref:recombinase family protein n=1 Tax=Enterococcus thailandicus TaxID=417368 RepID=UPI00244D8AB9|nr:recombinase family protein [Enterococcus thailandicus]GMC02583.1 DNA invertase [Enterococcus thailandicus]GMC08980.1 DNA invertase [Enterococcus thailandicus]
MSKTVAYARTSTNKQDLGIEVQLDAFKVYDPDIIFKEQISGRKEDREELQNALSILEQGDTFLIYRIDRLSRSVRQLINLEADLREKNIHLKIIHENIDTSTSMGRLIFNILATFAEMESENVSMRTKAALQELKKKGVKLGNKGLDEETTLKIIDLYLNTNLTQQEIATRCDVCLKTVYNIKKRNNLRRNYN